MIDETTPSLQHSVHQDVKLDKNGVWFCPGQDFEKFITTAHEPGPALFLDRDGVINIDVNYLSKIEDIELHKGVAGMIAAANRADIPVIVITNQSGIGRGYFDWQTLVVVQDEIVRQLAVHDAHWNAVIACPHHRDAQPPYKHDNHPFRKPNPGMLHLAASRLAIDLSRSWIIGDKADDLLAGYNAGLCGGIHVSTRFMEADKEREKAGNITTENFEVLCMMTVEDAKNALPLL